MTDVVSQVDSRVDGWVPRLGAFAEMDQVDEQRAGLLRGLFELAAWVADHPRCPVPQVVARMVPVHSVFSDECATVAEVAAELHTTAELRAGGQHYVAEVHFGPRVVAICAARTSEHWAADHLTSPAPSGHAGPSGTSGTEAVLTGGPR